MAPVTVRWTEAGDAGAVTFASADEAATFAEQLSGRANLDAGSVQVGSPKPKPARATKPKPASKASPRKATSSARRKSPAKGRGGR